MWERCLLGMDMNILELIEDVGLEPKRKAACHGGEYCSPCPFCKAGDDRFFIQPYRQGWTGGKFQCRVCGKCGDAIAFLRQFYGMSYQEACARLRIEPKKRSGIRASRPAHKLQVADDPSELWKNKAQIFVEWAHAQLKRYPESVNLLHARGFTDDSIDRFRLGFNPGEKRRDIFGEREERRDIFREREDWGLAHELNEKGRPKKLYLPIGITIPTFSEQEGVLKVKIRRTAYEKEMEIYKQKIEEGENPTNKPQKYNSTSGSKECPSIYGDTSLPCLVLESELDALLVQQEASDLVFCVALGGSTKPLDADTDRLIRSSPLALFLPDFDRAGAIAWVKWQKMFPDICRILTPEGKSAGDAYLAGIDLRAWIGETIEAINKKTKR